MRGEGCISTAYYRLEPAGRIILYSAFLGLILQGISILSLEFVDARLIFRAF